MKILIINQSEVRQLLPVSEWIEVMSPALATKAVAARKGVAIELGGSCHDD